MTYLTADVILGRMTPRMAEQAVCRNPSDCSRSWHGSEDIIRRRFTAERQREIWAGEKCPQCGHRFPSDIEVVLAMLSPDSAALPLAPVEGS
jgi:hypothetical protein